MHKDLIQGTLVTDIRVNYAINISTVQDYLIPTVHIVKRLLYKPIHHHCTPYAVRVVSVTSMKIKIN